MKHKEKITENTTLPETGESANAVTVPAPDNPLTPKQRRKKIALQWILMNVGALMMAAGVYFFQAPNNFTLGGISGLSIILSKYITPKVHFLTQPVIMMIINVFLLILGLIILGKKCTLLTVVCSLLYTFEIWLFELIFTDALHIRLPLTDPHDPLLELCYAILFMGVGGALIFNCNASSGGTDIIALILKKYTKINVGMALMIIDMIVVCISFYTFKDTAAYAVMGLFAKSFLLDGVIEGMGKTKYITIITNKPDLIGDYILKVIKHGYTMYDAEGGYTHEKKKVMITICKRSEALRLKTKVKAMDPAAFIIITDANEILGKGFGPAI